MDDISFAIRQSIRPRADSAVDRLVDRPVTIVRGRIREHSGAAFPRPPERGRQRRPSELGDDPRIDRSGNHIVAAARRRAVREGPSYAYASAPRSPLPDLTGNQNPGITRPAWLHGRNKCNQYVGDALYDAGHRLPTFRMPDGTAHYVNAEALLRYPNTLQHVADIRDARPGDLLVLDYPGRGADTAHVEIISDVGLDAERPLLRTIGAHRDGVRETDRTSLLQRDGACEGAGGPQKDRISRSQINRSRDAVPRTDPVASRDSVSATDSVSSPPPRQSASPLTSRCSRAVHVLRVLSR